MKKLFERTGWSPRDIDLFEINGAFAVVPMAAIRDLGLPSDGVNIHGGACALGHPPGASGARVVVTLLAALEKYGLRRGVAWRGVAWRGIAVHRRRRGNSHRHRACSHLIGAYPVIIDKSWGRRPRTQTVEDIAEERNGSLWP
jgi:hypothetical protein